VIFVDTPGFSDTFKDDGEILERIAKWLENASVVPHRSVLIDIEYATGTRERTKLLDSSTCMISPKDACSGIPTRIIKSLRDCVV
jgi:hypothetical protein